MTDETVPEINSCRPCQTLKPVKTTIGSGYGCPVCQMTYIQMNKGTYIPFDQALALAAREQKRHNKAQTAKLQPKPRKPKKKRRRR